MTYAFNRLFIDSSNLPMFVAIDTNVAADFGLNVPAVEMNNAEYDARHEKFSGTMRMKPPPSHQRIFPSYLVIRKLGTSEEYETWMPDHVFEDLYESGDGI